MIHILQQAELDLKADSDKPCEWEGGGGGVKLTRCLECGCDLLSCEDVSSQLLYTCD